MANIRKFRRISRKKSRDAVTDSQRKDKQLEQLKWQELK